MLATNSSLNGIYTVRKSYLKKVGNSSDRLNDMRRKIISYLEQLDAITFNHSVRVMMIAEELEEFMGIDDHKLMSAAIVHDIGKLYIPHRVLDKNGSLTSLERELIDIHPYVGYSFLKDLGVSEDICRIVLYHHGFSPICIKRLNQYDNASVYQKSVALRTIDSFEALTSDRPYHRGVPSYEAISILLNEGNFDKSVMRFFEKVLEMDIKDSAVRRTWKQPSLDEIEGMVESMSF